MRNMPKPRWQHWLWMWACWVTTYELFFDRGIGWVHGIVVAVLVADTLAQRSEIAELQRALEYVRGAHKRCYNALMAACKRPLDDVLTDKLRAALAAEWEKKENG